MAAQEAREPAKPVKPTTLRAALSEALGAAGEQAAPAPRELLPADLADQHPLSILLAEDNAVNQKLALKLLERMGYEADVAINGIEAVAAVKRKRYDLVLMDVQMPKMDGLEASRRIIESRASGRPRIVALTADAMQDDRERCLAAGMDDYLTKPIRRAELTAALERAGQHTAVPLDPEACDRLLETAGDDPEFVTVLLESFNNSAPAVLQELRDGMSSRDSNVVRRAAHTLKSNAATFGATDLCALCAELETHARVGELPDGQEVVERIESAYLTVRAALETWRATLARV